MVWRDEVWLEGGGGGGQGSGVDGAGKPLGECEVAGHDEVMYYQKVSLVHSP